MANEAAKASTKGQVIQIVLSYPQQSSTQKFISLFPLKIKLIFIATVNLKQSDEKKILLKQESVLFIHYTWNSYYIIVRFLITELAGQHFYIMTK